MAQSACNEKECVSERGREGERGREKGDGKENKSTFRGKDNFTGPTLMTVTSEIGRVAGSGGDSAMMCVTSSLR